MKPRLLNPSIALAAGLLLPAGAPAAPAPAAPPAESPVLLSAAERLKQLDLQLRLRELELERTAVRAKAGAEPQSAVGALEAEVASLRLQRQALERLQVREQRVDLLRRVVGLQLRNASVRQAAEALAQATGLELAVDGQVPTDARLSVTVQGVAVGSVLEAIARQAKLMIAPGPKIGAVVLKPWPSLEINGSQQPFLSPSWPWSADWGFADALRAPGGYTTLFDAAASEQQTAARTALPAPADGVPTPLPPPPVAAPPILPSGRASLSPREMTAVRAAAAAAGGPVSVTALGDRILVVAQPFTDGSGEPAVLLTVYRLEGNLLNRVSTLIQRADGTGQRVGGPRSRAGQKPE